MLRPALLAVLLALPSAAFPSQAQTPAPSDAPAYRSDPKFQKALDATKTPRMPIDDVLSAWKKANKIANGQCTECLRQIIALNNKLGQSDDAAKAANQLVAIATLPNDKFFAENALGSAIINNADKPKNSALQQAADAFNAALALSPHAATPRYQLGRTLAMMGRDDEARNAFNAFLADAGPTDMYRTRAEHFAANPHLAALRMSPPFTVHTAQGETFSLDNMQGKVVLLDFWASWCGPCRETLPDVKRVAAKYKDAPFVVLSVSIDADPDAWQKAVDREGMTWPQYRDTDHRLATAYGASSIPRFFTIDTDGVLQDIKVGGGTDLDGMIRPLIGKAIAAQKRKAQSTPTQSVGQ